MRIRIKICCISSVNEARMAVEAGVDAVGLVSSMPSGPGVIREPDIAAIAATIGPPTATFLLTSLADAGSIIAQQRRCGTNTIQLVDRVTEETHAALRSELPGVRIVQVIHVAGEASVAEACALEKHVDALLLDSGNPTLAVKELGGTGRTHDWQVSRKICEAVRIPVFLAGGLNAENVREAIETVHPFGVDVCSGVRMGGKLDAGKLRAFVRAASDAPLL